MAQRIVLVCDQHQAEGQEDVAGVTWRIGVQVPGGRFQVYDVDSCAEHAKPFLDLAQFLSDLGRPVKGKGGQDRAPRAGDLGEPEADRTCPVCGFVSVNRTAMRTHLRNQHDQSLAEATGQGADLACPECGRTFDAPQGLAAHRRRSHGVAGRGSSGAQTGA